ncbi:MAG: hypothetical protein R2867_11210 [Caldilineaceae bacterium]
MSIFCEREGLPADFISTHHYPTDAFGEPDDDTEAQLAAAKRAFCSGQWTRGATPATARFTTPSGTLHPILSSTGTTTPTRPPLARSAGSSVTDVVQGYSY